MPLTVAACADMRYPTARVHPPRQFEREGPLVIVRGCNHPHAIRILARAWLGVIWRAWTDRKPYDPKLHNAALKLAPSAGG